MKPVNTSSHSSVSILKTESLKNLPLGKNNIYVYKNENLREKFRDSVQKVQHPTIRFSKQRKQRKNVKELNNNKNIQKKNSQARRKTWAFKLKVPTKCVVNFKSTAYLIAVLWDGIHSLNTYLSNIYYMHCIWVVTK